jgi:outer membrane protein
MTIIDQLRTSKPGLILAVLCASIPAAAQVPSPAPAATPLTLAEAEALAIKLHPQIATAQHVAEAAEQGTVEARAAYYPVVNAEITASQGLDLSRMGAGTLSTSLLFNRFGQGLQLNQLVSDFGRTKNLVANAKFQALAAGQTTRATVFDVVLRVDQAYYAALQAESFVRVAEETVKARQTLVDQVNALAQAQLRSQVDVSFAQVNLSEARLLLIRAQDTVKRAYADLTRALGQDKPVAYRLVDSPVTQPPPPDPQPLVTEAVQNRPELSELRLRVQAAQSFETAEKDLSHPNVNLIAVGGALPYINQDPRIAPHGYEGVAINLEIPIFNGHLFSARRRSAHYQTLAEDQRLRNLQQQVERDVRAALITAETAYQRIPVTEELLKQAGLSLDLAQGRYNLGLASIVEVSQAQLNLTQAQIENVSAKYDYEIAYAGLQFTIGALK